MIPLTNKPIAITGASSGIGLAAAFACAKAGMPVALAARRADRLESAVQQITAGGGKAIAVACDVTKPDDCNRLVAETIRSFGSIYSVFANAGYGIESRADAITDQELRDIFETNFFGTMFTIRPALAQMKQAGAGHVLICSSAGSKIGVPMLSAYTATKAAQDHIGRALRIELAGTGILVSTIHPIGTHTEFSKVLVEHSDGRKRNSETPPHRKQTVEVVAAAIVRCLEKPKGEVWTHFPTRLALAAATLLPSLGDAVLRKKFAKR
jgi:short-subunit dehydrogenase